MHNIIPKITKAINKNHRLDNSKHIARLRQDSLYALQTKFLEQHPNSWRRFERRRDERVKLSGALFRARSNRVGDESRKFTQVAGRLIPGPALKKSHREGDYLLRLRYDGWGSNFWSSKSSKELRDKRTAAGGFKRAGARMRSYIQFVTTPTADTPGTMLLLHFDNRRYLIGNVGEGSQRACVQRNIRLGKVENLFLTGKTDWATTGGLMGMILTLADSSSSSRAETAKKIEEKAKRLESQEPSMKEKLELEKRQVLNIHGAKNLTHMLATARRFIFRKGMPLYSNEYRETRARKSDEPDYTDTNIKMWAMVVSPENGDRTRKRSHEEFAEEEKATEATAKLSIDEEDAADQIRRSVVSSMFDSDWKLDALHPTKLSEVKQPASIFVRKENKLEKYNGPMPGQSEFEDMEVLVRKPWPGALIESLPSTKPSKSAVSYIIKNHPQRGRFDPVAAIRLKVNPGPNFAKLTRGENVEASDGSIVTPDMVLSPTKPGSGFAIIELPTVDYVPPMIQRSEWASEGIMNGVGAVVWILGPGVGADERLLQFMREHSRLEHLITAPDHCANSLALESPASAAIRLHLVDPERFPVPAYNNVPAVKHEVSAPYSVARSGLVVELEPDLKKKEDTIIKFLDTTTVINEMPKDVLELANQAREELNQPTYQAALEDRQKDLPGKDAEIITLGTGSSLPSKYRNVSATLLKIPGVGNYILDCGENTLGQIKRVFGTETPSILRDLKAIWISHLHADHHLGTASVIREWHAEISASASTKDNKLIVSSDIAMLNWLKEYSEVEDFGYSSVLPISLSRPANEIRHKFSEIEAATYGLTSIHACRVSHCHGALAVVLSFTNDLKVSYSGDCRPSPEFARIGKGSTLLIHEATFDDELIGDALAKKHSTTGEALEVGRKMGARRIMLTHFSQRYQKIPVLEAEGDVRTAVAFDYMRVRIEDIARLEMFRGALLKLYEEEKKVEKKEAEEGKEGGNVGEAQGEKTETKKSKKNKKKNKDSKGLSEENNLTMEDKE